MYLIRCEIFNYRSIKDLTIGFEHNFQILVGLNEAGKSNILNALSFIDPSKVPEDDDIRDHRLDEDPVDIAYIRYVFGLEKKKRRKEFTTILNTSLCPKTQIILLYKKAQKNTP